MKNLATTFFRLFTISVVLISINSNSVYSQCPNVGFESCDFTGWQGTFAQSDDFPATGGSEGCLAGTGPQSFMNMFIIQVVRTVLTQ